MGPFYALDRRASLFPQVLLRASGHNHVFAKLKWGRIHLVFSRVTTSIHDRGKPNWRDTIFVRFQRKFRRGMRRPRSLTLNT